MNTRKIMDTIQSLDKKITYGASIAAALLMLAAGYGFIAEDESYAAVQKGETPVTVQTMTVEPSPVDAVVAATGTLTSKNISVLSSKVMGRVVELNVQEGDFVSQGTVLLKIESGEISAQTYQAQAAFNNAKLHFDRIKSLFDQQASTQMEMDQATLGFESAKAGLNAAKAMESYATIAAPISGQIVEKMINLGETALPGQPILKIEDNRNLRFEATIREQDLRFVQAGKQVLVRIDAMPDTEIKARVAQVVPASDIRTHSFIVKIDIPANKSLITGMYGKALFSTGKRDVILIPKKAVVEMSGLTGVYIASQEGTAVFQMITPGRTYGDNVEVVIGLKSGDTVIVNRQDGSIDGRKVVLATNGR